MKTMASAGILLAMVACSGRLTPSGGGRTRVTYDVDVERVASNRLSEIKLELVRKNIDTSVTRTGSLIVTPFNPDRRGELQAELSVQYPDQLAIRTCGAPLPGEAICVDLATVYKQQLQQHSSDRAVEVVRARLAAWKIEASVRREEQQLVIEIAKDDPQLATLRAMVPRLGWLELAASVNTSPFMQRVVDHATGQERSGNVGWVIVGEPTAIATAPTTTDAAALRAGIRVGIDQWPNDGGGGIHIDQFLVAAGRPAIESYLQQLAINDPSFRIPEDGRVAFGRVESPTGAGAVVWRTYYLDRSTAVPGMAITSARVATDPNTGRAVVLVEFGARGADLFDDLTAQNVGRKLAVLLDDEVRNTMIIESSSRVPRASISMSAADPDVQKRDAEEIVFVLKDGGMATPLLEVAVDVVP